MADVECVYNSNVPKNKAQLHEEICRLRKIIIDTIHPAQLDLVLDPNKNGRTLASDSVSDLVSINSSRQSELDSHELDSASMIAMKESGQKRRVREENLCICKTQPQRISPITATHEVGSENRASRLISRKEV